ncbi:MAG TPA: helix-turn-helix domain-containing protein, partial [Rhizobiaceae bacterium]|nr:helix-turn-helix domain-containing protein [Rhizobiaceae bacterium]
AYLGTTPESISRAIHKFAREGLVRIVDPLSFEIVQREALIRASGREEFRRVDQDRLIQRMNAKGLATVR